MGGQQTSPLKYQGPVVQSTISLTSFLRGQLIKYSTTSTPITLIFLFKKWEKLKELECMGEGDLALIQSDLRSYSYHYCVFVPRRSEKRGFYYMKKLFLLQTYGGFKFP